MSKLLIIGDSFAADPSIWFHNYDSWVEILRKETNYDITNKAVGGSSLFYASEIFYKLQSTFEKIILVETNSGRRYCPIPALDINVHKTGHHFTQGLYQNNLNKQKLDKGSENYLQGLKTLEAIEQFYLYVYNWKEHNYYHELMLEDLMMKRPDMIVIPAFHDSKYSRRTKSCLNDISDLEFSHYNITHEHLSHDNGRIDIRPCHMSADNNRILAEKVKLWLTGAPVEIDVRDFKKPNVPINEYFPFRKEWNKKWMKT